MTCPAATSAPIRPFTGTSIIAHRGRALPALLSRTGLHRGGRSQSTGLDGRRQVCGIQYPGSSTAGNGPHVSLGDLARANESATRAHPDRPIGLFALAHGLGGGWQQVIASCWPFLIFSATLTAWRRHSGRDAFFCGHGTRACPLQRDVFRCGCCRSLHPGAATVSRRRPALRLWKYRAEPGLDRRYPASGPGGRPVQ